MYPSSLRKIIECLKDLPGIGEKSAERLSFTLINFDKDKLQDFAEAILELKNNIHRCPICNNITDKDICSICSDESKKNNIIFVVEKPKDIILFEKLNIYKGKYHVLDGLISPLEGLGPDDINIDSLLKRIDNQQVEEVILALKPSIEGETTMQYIKKILEKYDVRVSKIATGIPIGTEIEYIDTMTLELAFEERKNI